VQQLIAGVKASAERFGDYRVLNVTSDPDAPWYIGSPMATWRNGTKSRLVAGMVDTGAPPVEVPQGDVNEHQWWKKRWSELIYIPAQVDDGKRFWTNDAYSQATKALPNTHPRSMRRADRPQPNWRVESGWRGGMQCFPLLYVYPDKLSVDYPLEAELEPHPSEGPANTVRLIVRGKTAQSNVSSEWRMWIDPARSYMIVRHEITSLDTSKTPPLETLNRTYLVQQADRSPRGIWYPTLIRYTGTWEENGQKKTQATVTRSYFDFDVNFSDDTFKAVELPGEPLE
jgi:hypothetical protein